MARDCPVPHERRAIAMDAGVALAVGFSRIKRSDVCDDAGQARRLVFQPGCGKCRSRGCCPTLLSFAVFPCPNDLPMKLTVAGFSTKASARTGARRTLRLLDDIGQSANAFKRSPERSPYFLTERYCLYSAGRSTNLSRRDPSSSMAAASSRGGIHEEFNGRSRGLGCPR